MEEKYQKTSELLEEVWLGIDWEGMNTGRRLKIWEEFENQVRALSKCYSSLNPFLEKICKRFNSFLSKNKIIEIVTNYDNEEILDVLRYETKIPILLMKLRREEAKEEFEKRDKNNITIDSEMDFKEVEKNLNEVNKLF